jgi:hypothetical protein
MKRIILLIILVVPLKPSYAQDIIPEIVEINKIPESLSKSIDKFFIALNKRKSGNVKLLTLDLTPNFREIVVPDSFKSPENLAKSDFGFKMKSLLKIDDKTYLLVYDSKNPPPGGELMSAIWVMGVNSWHINMNGDPPELAIQKLNISRAMAEIQSSASEAVPNN